ncbi:hypothetical protein ACVW0Y_002913 [Pseudomonas sp. TE3786]
MSPVGFDYALLRAPQLDVDSASALPTNTSTRKIVEGPLIPEGEGGSFLVVQWTIHAGEHAEKSYRAYDCEVLMRFQRRFLVVCAPLPMIGSEFTRLPRWLEKRVTKIVIEFP